MSSSNLHSPEEIREAAMAVGNALARCESTPLLAVVRVWFWALLGQPKTSTL